MGEQKAAFEGVDSLADLNALNLPEPPFTPGPWSHAHRKGADGMHRTQVFDAAGEEIATLAWYPFRRPEPHEYITGTSRAANARLIAAAPDLLAALEDLRAAATDAYKAGRIAAEPFVRAGNAIEKARGSLNDASPTTAK